MNSMKISKLALFPLAAMILAGCSGNAQPEEPHIDDGWDGDPISYVDVDDSVDYNTPSRIIRDEAQAKIVLPSKLILHYHNDDMAVKNRRFYTWVTGVDGEERKADHYSETDMDITIDFNAFPEYKDSPSFFFIVKVAGTWAGQSQDIQIDYENWQEKIEENGETVEVSMTDALKSFFGGDVISQQTYDKSKFEKPIGFTLTDMSGKKHEIQLGSDGKYHGDIELNGTKDFVSYEDLAEALRKHDASNGGKPSYFISTDTGVTKMSDYGKNANAHIYTDEKYKAANRRREAEQSGKAGKR